ncbi:MAG: hypothetical protein C0490_23950, partial [Marivirga sp.]|nr:hypothetical protein [Marivirga sp.]
MYYTSLPDHRTPGFDEQLHFHKFKQHNIIFNALTSKSYCEDHVGCLSFKTVLSGEEWYRINNHQKAVRPGQFLILNDDQTYSSRINTEKKTRSLSIFFRKEFATSVFRDVLSTEESLLEDPFESGNKILEFFQTLCDIDSSLQQQLAGLIFSLEEQRRSNTYIIDEQLIFLLHHLICAHQ